MLQHAQAGHGAGPPLGWPGSVADAQRGPVSGSPPGSLQQQQGRFAGSSPQGRDIPAPDTTSASSQQTTLFPQFSPEAAAELFSSGSSAGGGGAAAHQQQQAALKQNLQKLYGSLGLQHGSRSSLPDIQEDEPQTSLPSDPPLVPPSAAGRLPPHGRAPSGRAMSDEDLFGMQDLHHAAGQQQAAAAGSAAGAGLGPPPAADLSLVGQLPAGSAQSRTLFVRNVDPAVPEDELRTLFEVGGCCAGVVLLLGWGVAVCGNKRCPRESDLLPWLYCSQLARRGPQAGLAPAPARASAWRPVSSCAPCPAHPPHPGIWRGAQPVHSGQGARLRCGWVLRHPRRHAGAAHAQRAGAGRAAPGRALQPAQGRPGGQPGGQAWWGLLGGNGASSDVRVLQKWLACAGLPLLAGWSVTT